MIRRRNLKRRSAGEGLLRRQAMVRGIRAVIMSLLNNESSPKPPATAAGTAVTRQPTTLIGIVDEG